MSGKYVTIEKRWRKINREEKLKDRKIMAAATVQETGRVRGQGYQGLRGRRLPGGAQRARIPLEKDQCAFCKQREHWKRERPQLKYQGLEEMPKQFVNILDSD